MTASYDRRLFLRRLAVLGGAAAFARVATACDDDTITTRDTLDADDTNDTTSDTAATLEPDATTASEDTTSAPDVEPDATLDVEPLVCEPTTNDAQGPFYVADAPSKVDLSGTLAGDKIALSGRVRDADCVVIAGAIVEVWQADDDGDYHDDLLRATLAPDADGRWSFTSIMPGRYLQATGLRPAHIHFRVTAPGFRTVVTQLYFEGDPYLQPNDSCTSCGSDDPARIIPMVLEGDRATGVFDVTLARA